MADSLQMMDLVSLSKNQNQLRGTDPAQRAAAGRLAAAAAAQELEELHQEVEESEQAREARLRERRDRGGSNPDPRDHPDPRREPAKPPPQPVPEQNEGHLLNLKV
jgi:hypothetical protein